MKKVFCPFAVLFCVCLDLLTIRVHHLKVTALGCECALKSQAKHGKFYFATTRIQPQNTSLQKSIMCFDLVKLTASGNDCLVNNVSVATV
eukprot:4497741-Ditylum_brightwellii.AAC.1